MSGSYAELAVSLEALGVQNPALGKKVETALAVIERCLALYGVRHRRVRADARARNVAYD